MAPNELQELFDRLKAQNAASRSPSQAQSSVWADSREQVYQQPSVSSPLFSPPAQTPEPIHSANIISPVNPASMVGTPVPDQTRTNNLLNLLKFSNPGSQASPMANLQNVGGVRGSTINLGTSDGAGPAYPRPVSAQDLMASFQRKTSSQNVTASPAAAAGVEKMEPVTQTGSSKDFLLGLLTKPKDTKPIPMLSTDDIDEASVIASIETPADKFVTNLAEVNVNPTASAQPAREPTPVRYFGSVDSNDKTPFEAPQPTKPSLFNYVNPFDQLHSSSPLNLSPKPAAQTGPKKVEILKHNRDPSSSANSELLGQAAEKKKKLSSGAPSPAPPEPEKSKSVSEALKGVADTVDKQVEAALAQANVPEVPMASIQTPSRQTEHQDTAREEDDVQSSWESAEDEEAEKADELIVEVFNFPMKPFVAIHIKQIDNPPPLRQDHFVSVAKLKKEFDQMDRTLVTASQSHILYAQLATKKDTGGFRVIRQDDGQNKHVFRSSDERVFTVQICSSKEPGNNVETILGTGVNGSVFWTTLAKSGAESFADDDVEAQGFIMPAVSTHEEQTSGSQVKTRAKMSSRHSEYFAVARGSQIQIVVPHVVKGKAYRNTKNGKINSEQYQAEHGLRIAMGKACKDFCFSEDDTTIATLDKSGRITFWDIKDLTRRASTMTEDKHDPVEVRDPLWSLHAATSGSKPDEKPSVSSIMFLDKERPTSRGLALRYMLVGFKQNHVLQLWDLGLGKAVQEIRLPHEKDSDGICSVTYHPRSGIIAVGHPTRNSIYFIHLSAPRYNIAHMDQSKYIHYLAQADQAIPRPESTAIMSGLREFSFAKVGQLRSLDMLTQPYESPNQTEDSEETLFELYVMHSRGVVDMPIKRKDLGWDKDSKMLKPVDALQAGVIEVHDLIAPLKPSAPGEQFGNPETPVKQTSKAVAGKKHDAAKSTASTPVKAEVIKREPSATPSTQLNGAMPSSKQAQEVAAYSAQTTVPPTPPSYAMAVQSTKAVVPEPVAAAVKSADPLPLSVAPSSQASSNDDLQLLLSRQFDSLYHRIDSEKRVQDATSAARQDAMLRLVSSTLTENVEKSLNRIVSENMTKQIEPSVTSSINKIVEKKLSETLPQQLGSHVSKELKAAMPHAIQQALKDPQVHGAISTQVAQKVQQQVSQLLQQSMPNLATQATQKVVADLEHRTKQQLQQVEVHRQQDNARLQEIFNLVHGLSQMVQNMSESQAAFQEQILKMQRSPGSAPSQEESVRDVEKSEPPTNIPKTAEEQEVEHIEQLLQNWQFDAATMAWLQSARQGALFDQVFLRVNPRYLEKVTPLISLSVSAAITASLTTHLPERLEWLAVALDTVDLSDQDIKEVAPKIMTVLSARLQGVYMDVSESNPADPSLRRISALNKKVLEVQRLAE